MHRILLLLLICFSLTPARLIAAELRICNYDNPPLGFTDEQGLPQGLLPGLFNEIAQREGWQLEYVPATWDQCLQGLQQGEFDILPAIAYSAERAQQFRFAEETVMVNWGQVYQRLDSAFDSIPSLSGRKVAVLKNDIFFHGGHGLKDLTEHYAVQIDFVEVDTYLQAFARLSRGDVDAALVNRVFALNHQKLFDLQPTPIQLYPVQLRPAFSATLDPKIQATFDRYLRSWKQAPDSPFFQLKEKWLENKPVRPMPVWLRYLMYFLSALLLTMIFSTIWARRQVQTKTRLLEEKHRQLEDELVERLQVEKELLERQQQYQVLFEDSKSSMLLIDPPTAVIVDANPSACQFYQYERSRMQGMPIQQLNGLGEQQVRELISRIEANMLQCFELQHRMADGELRDVEIQSSQIVVEGRSLICSIIHDISQRKCAERELEKRSEFLQAVIDGVVDPLMVIGADYRVLQMNRAARQRVASGDKSEMAYLCYQVSHGTQVPCSGQSHPCPLEKVRETGEAQTLLHRHVTKEGERVIELNASPLFDADGKFVAVIEVARDITERLQVETLLNENEKRLLHLAHHDPLTDLPNRLLFEDRIKQALSKARRSRKQVALFFLDLDHFKDINDNLGHDAGDLLLIDIAQRLQNCVRESDTVARMGGDEFLILLDEVDSIGMVEAMAERICQALAHELTRDNYYQRVSASIGISLYPEDGTTSQELLRNADQAMYRAKNHGKATYQFYSPHDTGSLF